MISRVSRFLVAPLALAALLCGCVVRQSDRANREMAQSANDHFNATYEASGAPFRYLDLGERTLLGTPAPTTANDAVQADAIAAIGRAELAMKGRSTPVKIREVRSWPGTGPGVREIWVLENTPPPRTIAYVITFTAAAAGTEIDLKGPFE